MAAIWGVVTFNEEDSVAETKWQTMNTIYSCRCQFDRIDQETCGHAAFAAGVQWLRLQDRQESMPVYDAEQCFLMAADCYLDNREELCSLLEVSSDLSDGTLVCEAYRRFHGRFVEYLRGLYAIAIWNERDRRLELYTDHTASRCLYYCRRGAQLVFSTLLEPLVAYFPNLAVNIAYEKDFLLADAGVIYVVPGETPLQEVYLMTPASQVIVDRSELCSNVYWTLEQEQPDIDAHMQSCHSAQDYLGVFMELYEACVGDALCKDAHTGISMSSGLDSASIGALAARQLADKGQKLYAYTYVPYLDIGIKRIGDYILDESGIVKEIAETYSNMEITTLNGHGRNAFATMRENMQILEMPTKGGLFASLKEVCENAAAKDCRVLLHGAYGNTSVSYGNVYHVGYDLYEHREYGRLCSMLSGYCRKQRQSLLREFVNLLVLYRRTARTSDNIPEHFVPDNGFLLPQMLDGYSLECRLARNRHLRMWNRPMDADSYHEYLEERSLMIYLGVFETKYGLQHRMIVRDPTKDMRMLHFCRCLPYELFAQDGIPRWLIRQGFRDRLPKDVLNNWNQRGRQNIDWLDRIVRDWEQIRDVLLLDIDVNITENSTLGRCINKKLLMDYIADLDVITSADQYRMADILAVESLLSFHGML